MKCIILAAGVGVRTYPVTSDMPKSLLPIRGKPAIARIVNKVQVTEGIDEIFIISSQRFLPQFNEWLDGFATMVPTRIINDGSLNCKDSLGAVKSLDFVINSCGIDDDLLVIGGDNLFSFSLDEFIESSLAAKPNPSIGVYDLNGRYKAKKYGVVKLDAKGRVIDFYEKPPQVNGSYLISLCLYYLPKEILSSINTYLCTIHNTTEGSPVRTHDAIRNKNDPIGNYIKWLVKKCQVQSFNFKGDWFDIGDVDSYAEAVCLL